MLDGMLHGYPGRPENASKSLAPDALKNRDEDQGAGAQAKRLHKLAGKVRHFVEGEGGLDGAQFEEYVQHPSSDCNTCLTSPRP